MKSNLQCTLKTTEVELILDKFSRSDRGGPIISKEGPIRGSLNGGHGQSLIHFGWELEPVGPRDIKSQ